MVDWGKLACTAHQEYSTAVKNVGKVGQHVGKFISWLHTESLVSLNNTHIVGHSLGSHVAGKAGDTVNRTVGYPVGRITGLFTTRRKIKLHLRLLRKFTPLFQDWTPQDLNMKLKSILPEGFVQTMPSLWTLFTQTLVNSGSPDA